MTKPPTYVKEAAEEIRAKTGNLIFRLLGSAHALPLTEIESILLKYPPQPSEWVDVRDRLPDEKQAIDAYNQKDEQRVQTRFLSEDMFCGRPWFTHWTPLLPPPEQKEKV